MILVVFFVYFDS